MVFIENVLGAHFRSLSFSIFRRCPSEKLLSLGGISSLPPPPPSLTNRHRRQPNNGERNNRRWRGPTRGVAIPLFTRFESGRMKMGLQIRIQGQIHNTSRTKRARQTLFCRHELRALSFRLMLPIPNERTNQRTNQTSEDKP